MPREEDQYDSLACREVGTEGAQPLAIASDQCPRVRRGQDAAPMEEEEAQDADAIGSCRRRSAADSHSPPSTGLPLTHPNGTYLFPTLSTSEQENLAREALSQAEDSIAAESLDDVESDGGYGSDGLTSASMSAESSVRDYLYENGRRYHRFREGSYSFPNDDVEQEREDMKHAMVKLLCNQKLHFAPIGHNPQEVLDIGTGTGTWAIESKSLQPHRAPAPFRRFPGSVWMTGTKRYVLRPTLSSRVKINLKAVC